MTELATDNTYARLTREPLPASLGRRIIEIPPDAERLTAPAEWFGALVVLDRGRVQVRCAAGATREYRAGAYLVLACLPIRALYNPGPEPARLVAVTRRLTLVASSDD